jgi:hypothetical protein
MSRTIRRKGYSRELKWQTETLIWEGNTLVRVPLDRHSREYKENVAKYRSDGGKFMGPAPGWYNAFWERTVRQHGKRQILNWLGDSEYPVQCISQPWKLTPPWG